MSLPVDRPLTERRIQILRHLANGLTTDEIAAEIHIGRNSVLTHLQYTYRQLGARNGAHAVAIAMVRGFVEPHEVPLPAPRAPLRRAK
ncbi:helix-turn-helix transcriptional regulator [Streptomyces sp. MP131-18]|uniref:response regulator transcription factor n=1 Tax=Streptomyces sp. MP131-18 TaxID=1857892 RepID=UPI00097BD002|nr:HTH-type quorum sensing-dependent transcriptional regulator VjbR [Streptomyces sp. MP131-18]